jgi:hypothetical protein
MKAVKATFRYDGRQFVVYGRSCDDCIERVIDRMGANEFRELGRFWRSEIEWETSLVVVANGLNGVIDALNWGLEDGQSFELW